jgi:spermidine/putrescine transport system permease protein
MNNAIRRGALYAWTTLVFAFILVPICSTIAFSINADRFPSLPWAGFSLTWYRAIFTDDRIRTALGNSLIVASTTAAISTFIGFATAYVDYRYRFVGKQIYIALAVLPPTVPVVIFGVAMLTFEGLVGLSGSLVGIIVAHVVICAPFAMALVRMRLAELDRDLEGASWNLGATPWRTMAEVILPFCSTALMAALFITAAVSFDEFMIAWFVSGIHETLPVRVLDMLQGQVSPRINAVGSIVFGVSITLVVLAQLLAGSRLANAATGRRA